MTNVDRIIHYFKEHKVIGPCIAIAAIFIAIVSFTEAVDKAYKKFFPSDELSVQRDREFSNYQELLKTNFESLYSDTARYIQLVSRSECGDSTCIMLRSDIHTSISKISTQLSTPVRMYVSLHTFAECLVQIFLIVETIEMFENTQVLDKQTRGDLKISKEIVHNCSVRVFSVLNDTSYQLGFFENDDYVREEIEAIRSRLETIIE